MRIIKSHSIKLTIIRVTMLITLTLCLTVSTICFFTFESLLKNKIELSTASNLQLIMNSFTSNMSDIQTLSKWCSSNTLLSKFLVSDEESLKSNSIKAWDRLNEEYRNNHSFYYIERIVVGNADNRYLQVTNRTSLRSVNIPKIIQSRSYFDELYHAFSFEWIGLVENDYRDYTDELIIPIIRPVDNVNSSDKVGWVFVCVNSNILTDALKLYDIPSDSNMYLTIKDKTYLIKDHKFYLTDDLNGITYTSSKIQNTSIAKIKTASGKTEQLVTYHSNLKDWSLSQTLSPSLFSQQKSTYIILVLLIGGIVLTVGMFLLIYLNNRINRPLRKLTDKMNSIASGDFSIDKDIEWDNELGQIGVGINKLSGDIVQLIEEKVHDEKERQSLEYQMLQSQINPHFLYNTLNSIKWMATIQKATGISEMTTALSRLMKSVSKDTQPIISIENELDLLNNYFIIQNYRYGGTIKLTITVATDDLYACSIPKFTLQPMVENAIFHGIEPKGEAGKIDINITSEGELVIITIKDNGIGIAADKLSELLTHNDSNASGFFKQIGVSNVDQRIKYAFGKGYGLQFDSVEGSYTIITITLPYITQEELN